MIAVLSSRLSHLSIRIWPKKKRIAALVSLGIALVILYYVTLSRMKERVQKYPQQCKKYPNELIRNISMGRHTFVQIEQHLEKLNINNGGTYFPSGKRNIIYCLEIFEENAKILMIFSI